MKERIINLLKAIGMVFVMFIVTTVIFLLVLAYFMVGTGKLA